MEKVEELEAQVATIKAALQTLTEEREQALDILTPNMRESGLLDACRQVKQVAISEAANSTWCEADSDRLKLEIVALKAERATDKERGYDEGYHNGFEAAVVASIKVAERTTLYVKCSACDGAREIFPTFTYSKHLSARHFDSRTRKVKPCETCAGVGFMPLPPSPAALKGDNKL